MRRPRCAVSGWRGQTSHGRAGHGQRLLVAGPAAASVHAVRDAGVLRPSRGASPGLP